MQKQTKPKPLGLSMAKLVLVVAVIAFLGAVLGVAGYVLTKQKCAVQNPPVMQKADETANWKTYKSEEFRFEFKYPKDWIMENFAGSALVSVGLNKAGYNRMPDTDMPNSVNFFLYESLANLDSKKVSPVSLEDYLDKYSSLSDPVHKNVISKKIGSLDGYEADAGPNQFGGGKYFFTELPNKQVVSFWFFNERTDQDIMNQILSTFKFIEKNKTE